MDSIPTRGVVHILSAPTALCPHVEWALSSVLGPETVVEWQAQSAAPGTHRTELHWQAPQGTGASLASALAPAFEVDLTGPTKAGRPWVIDVSTG